MKLSVIVPVYNVEQYLERCVQSIVAQNLTDYEIILVDDGSTDTSGVLCDELQRLFDNIRVIHQSNGGLSAARNTGLSVAQGRYITFVDSDDELYPNTLKENIEFLFHNPEVDMLEYPVEVHAGSADAYILTFSCETQCTDIFTDWIRREGYTHCYVCNKIFAARIWKGMFFPIGVYFEDGAIMPDIIRRCKCIHYSSHGCYRYIAHAGTITTSYKYVKSCQLFTNNYRLYLAIKDNPVLRVESMRVWTYCLNQLIDMGRCADVDKADYEHQIRCVDVEHPSYGELLGIMLQGPKSLKAVKLLPLPFIGLAAYLRIYVMLTASLK